MRGIAGARDCEKRSRLVKSMENDTGPDPRLERAPSCQPGRPGPGRGRPGDPLAACRAREGPDSASRAARDDEPGACYAIATRRRSRNACNGGGGGDARQDSHVDFGSQVTQMTRGVSCEEGFYFRDRAVSESRQGLRGDEAAAP